MTVAAFMTITTKVAMYSYVNKIVLKAIMAEYKLVVTHSVPNFFMFIGTIGLTIRPSQTKVIIWLVEP